MNTRHALPALVLLSVLVGAVALAGGVAAGASTQTANETADVSVDDQTGGESVTVAEATLLEGGFLVVYNGSGQIAGVSGYLEEGTHENVSVELSPALDRSQVVVAEARTDDGDESFNASDDTPYTNENDQPVGETAYVTVEGSDADAGTGTDDGTEASPDTETVTATTTAAGTAADEGTETETSGPGFGAIAALVAIAGAALLARR